MRADRLIACLRLLQRHGKVTALQVAQELEISERTARRDLDALALAGVPIFATRGRGGGWQLVGGARTDLSGLTGPEVRALFLAAGATPGQSPEVARALAKLQRAVPEPFRQDAARAAQALLIDAPGWRTGEPGVAGDSQEMPTPAWEAASSVLAAGRQADLHYQDRVGHHTTRRIHPLGLVRQATRWYLVADTDRGRRSFRLDRVSALEEIAEPAQRPEGFDLAAAWRELLAQARPAILPARVSGHGLPWAVRVASRLPGLSVEVVGPVQPDGRHQVEISGRSVVAVCGQLAGFGTALEITAPDSARAWLASLGQELQHTYAGSGSQAVGMSLPVGRSQQFA